ncbi:hypothetical protein [Reyranella sp.]|nr:hypothetical protein [Reyranella sp.]
MIPAIATQRLSKWMKNSTDQVTSPRSVSTSAVKKSVLASKSK